MNQVIGSGLIKPLNGQLQQGFGIVNVRRSIWYSRSSDTYLLDGSPQGGSIVSVLDATTFHFSKGTLGTIGIRH